MTTSCSICDFNLSPASLDTHVTDILQRIDSKQGGWIVTLNTEMLARCGKNPDYGNLLRQADLLVADGMPIVWAANKKYPDNTISGRTTGVDVVEKILNQADIPNFAIIGGVDPLTTLKKYTGAEEACKFLFNGMVDLSEEQISTFVDSLKEADVSIVYIALGVPKQDKLAVALRKILPELVYIGIGGTFEILSPTIGGRAPKWMQDSGLEWLYRFSREPGRLWKRYVVHYPVGVSMLIKDYLKRDRSQS